jgi:hypothetical protein
VAGRLHDFQWLHIATKVCSKARAGDYDFRWREQAATRQPSDQRLHLFGQGIHAPPLSVSPSRTVPAKATLVRILGAPYLWLSLALHN